MVVIITVIIIIIIVIILIMMRMVIIAEGFGEVVKVHSTRPHPNTLPIVIIIIIFFAILMSSSFPHNQCESLNIILS